MADLEERFRTRSLWFDPIDGSLAPRPSLDRDLDVDVAIVGAGYTGLWTAYELVRRDPTLRVAVLEAEIAGFGASRPQRRLVLRRVRRQPRRDREARTDATRPSHSSARCSRTVDEIGEVARRRGDRRRLREGRHPRSRDHGPAGSPAAGAGRGRARVGLRPRGRPLARAGRGPDRGCASPVSHGALYTPALRAGAAGSPRPRARRGRRAARRHDLRAHAGHRDQSPPGADHTRPGAGRRRRARDRGLHRTAPGAAADARAALLAHDRDRAAARELLGRGRLERARDLQRRPAPDHLRATHRRRPDRVRWPRRAVPLREPRPRPLRP